MSKRKPGDWWDQAWNPVTGCTPCSPACDNCWAQSFLTRFKQIHGGNDPRQIVLHENRLEAPLHWKNPRRVFVCNLSDLFHPYVPFEFIDRVFDVMEQCLQHEFFLLTKRPRNLKKYTEHRMMNNLSSCSLDMPISDNVWLGFTAWDQESFETAAYHFPFLNSYRMRDRYFLSLEPLLGPINLENKFIPIKEIDWIIVGGETGPKARPMQPEWVRSIRDQCVQAGVPFWFKSWGAHIPFNQMSEHDQYFITTREPENKRLLDGQEWSQGLNAKNSTK